MTHLVEILQQGPDAIWPGLPDLTTLSTAQKKSNLFDRMTTPKNSEDIFSAAKRGDVDKINALIESGTDVDEKNPGGDTALLLCALHGHEPCAQLLIEKGADVWHTNKSGNSALHLASFKGWMNMCKLLIASSSSETRGDDDVRIYDQVNEQGDTPVLLAAWEGHYDVTKYFIAIGADIARVTKNGETPETLAIKAKHFDIAEMLSLTV